MPEYKNFYELTIDVNLKGPSFRVLGKESQTGLPYQGFGANGLNGRLLEEVFDKTTSSYPQSAPVSLFVNGDTKRILQDPKWNKT